MYNLYCLLKAEISYTFYIVTDLTVCLMKNAIEAIYIITVILILTEMASWVMPKSHKPYRDIVPYFQSHFPKLVQRCKIPEILSLHIKTKFIYKPYNQQYLSRDWKQEFVKNNFRKYYITPLVLLWCFFFILFSMIFLFFMFFGIYYICVPTVWGRTTRVKVNTDICI